MDSCRIVKKRPSPAAPFRDYCETHFTFGSRCPTLKTKEVSA